MKPKANAISFPRSTGRCKLTGELGPYVDAHIIPLALSKLFQPGEKVIEAGIGLTPKRRSGRGWYDSELVTRAGEDILARIDSRAIEELRAHKLVWSAWESSNELRTEDLVVENGTPKVRQIRIADPTTLQLFF